MSKKLKWIIGILLLVIVVLVVLSKAGVLGKDEGTKVTAEKAAQRNITETVTATGKVFPGNQFQWRLLLQHETRSYLLLRCLLRLVLWFQPGD